MILNRFGHKLTGKQYEDFAPYIGHAWQGLTCVLLIGIRYGYISLENY